MIGKYGIFTIMWALPIGVKCSEFDVSLSDSAWYPYISTQKTSQKSFQNACEQVAMLRRLSAQYQQEQHQSKFYYSASDIIHEGRRLIDESDRAIRDFFQEFELDVNVH